LTKNAKSSQYPDDCGAWDSHSGRTVKTDFIVQSDNTLRYTCIKNDQYCVEKVRQHLFR